MPDHYEIRDLDEARRHLLQGLWLARVVPSEPTNVIATLEWAFRAAADGDPLPPIGFVADVFNLSLHQNPTTVSIEVPGMPSAELRRYEDYVLGKLHADLSFERGAEAVQRYHGEERAKAQSFLLNQIRVRGDLPAVILSPGLIKSLCQEGPLELLSEGFESLREYGLSDQLQQDYRCLTESVRLMGDALGREDIFELERGTAIEAFGQRVAIRQVIAASDQLERGLTSHKPAAIVRHHAVPTKIAEEDYYPIGGYSAISNRGTVESLLQSELMYIDGQQRPDLFDIKFARDELLYYSRDENQFFRRRQTFVFALSSALWTIRVKDANMPWQRIVLVLAFLIAAQRKLQVWLGDQALKFKLVFVKERRHPPLEDEFSLVERIFQEEIASGQVELNFQSVAELEASCDQHAKDSLCHCLWVACDPSPFSPERAIVSRLLVDAPEPKLELDGKLLTQDETGLEAWQTSLASQLQFWM